MCTYQKYFGFASCLQTCDRVHLFCRLYFRIKCSLPQHNTPNNLDNYAISKPGGKQGYWKGLMNNTQISITSSFNLANRRFRCQWKAIESARSAKPSKLHVLHSIVVNVTLKLQKPVWKTDTKSRSGIQQITFAILFNQVRKWTT